MARFGLHSGKLVCKGIEVKGKLLCSDLVVNNDLEIKGDLSFGNASTDTLAVNGTLIANGTATFNEAVTFEEETTFNNDIIITSNNVYAGGLVLGTKAIYPLDGTIIMNSDTQIIGNLAVTGLQIDNSKAVTTAYAGEGITTPATVAKFVKVTVGTTEYAVPLFRLTT